MNEKNLHEIAYRRQAFKLFDKGKSTHQMLRLIPRSRSWLFKWKRRFAKEGWAALDSLSKAPQRSPHQYDQSVVKLVLRVRARLEGAKVGMVGARAIFQELRLNRLVKELPSMATLKRWLREAGCFPSPTAQKAEAYYPAPQLTQEFLFVSCDWVARYLPGGVKVFVFHTLDQDTHALYQTIAPSKTAEVACRHLWQSARELGLADFLQVDNDAAFTGLGQKARLLGRFVRLALYLGVELIFIPPAEPKRNSLVERVNGLWVSSFWEKDHFASLGDLRQKRGRFLRWYESYAPPALQGLSVAEASQHVRRRKLSQREVESLPQELPLVEGRVHFVRRVDEQGRIEILKERWRVSKQLQGEYVWATIDLKKQSLIICHRRSPRAKAKIVKQYRYQIEERIEKLQLRYRRERKIVSVLQIM